jgi:hypothetical protein
MINLFCVCGRVVKHAKKRKNNKPRPPRITFKTRTDVDHLDDSYRWRKYGQKPVKNSPYPRYISK